MKNEKLAKGVKELRKRKGLSQEDLSEKTGLSLRTIQRVENDESEPSGETLRRVSSVLDVSILDLIDWGSDKVKHKKTIKTKYEYLHVYTDKLLITKTSEINDLVEDYGKSVNNIFKTLSVFFITIPIFTILSIIFYNIDMNGLAIHSAAFTFTFLVIAFYTILFTSGSSMIRLENINNISIQKKLFNTVVLISHIESGRLKVRTIVLDKKQADVIKNTLISEELIEKNIKLRGSYDLIYLFSITLVLIIIQFSSFFFKEVNTSMVSGLIIFFVSVIALFSMLLKLIHPFHQTKSPI